MGWLIPALAYVCTTATLGIVSKFALRTLSWQDMFVWMGVAYSVVVTVLLVSGATRLEITRGSGWAILSASLVIGGLVLFYLALARGEASKVIPVTAAYPAVTMVLSVLVLSESLTVGRVAGVALVAAGVVVITRPEPGPVA
jgi:transporter family protein